jgi:hypothetical protein
MLGDLMLVITEETSCVCGVQGDFDGDGDANDIYVLNAFSQYEGGGPDAVQLYLTDADGSYRAMPAGEALHPLEPREDPSVGGNPHAAVLGDFDGDGQRLDIFIANYESFGIRNHKAQKNTLLLGSQQPTPTFHLVQKRSATVPDVVARSDVSYDVVTGDFDCDGRKDDIYVLNSDSLLSSYVPGSETLPGGRNELLLRNDEVQGGYTAVHPSSGNPAVTSSGESRGGCVGDFNRDGEDDIFVVNHYGRHEVLLNQCDGKGMFSSSSTPASDTTDSTYRSWACAVADLDGDGIA